MMRRLRWVGAVAIGVKAVIVEKAFCKKGPLRGWPRSGFRVERQNFVRTPRLTTRPMGLAFNPS
jgi:hypothetical protein